MSEYSAVVVRDPDGGTDLRVFSPDGFEITAITTVFEVDAGRGCMWDDWIENRDRMLEAARAHGEGVERAVAAALDDPPGGRYIDGKPDDEPWLPEVSGE